MFKTKKSAIWIGTGALILILLSAILFACTLEPEIAALMSELKPTITFNVNGGIPASAPPSQKKDSGELVTPPTVDPVRAGYEFDGKWYKEAACTNEWVFATDTVTGSMTLYAGWTELTTDYSVIFDANGGTPAFTMVKVNNDNSTSVTAPAPPTITGGYFFGGWYKEKTCINEWNFSDPVTDNITLYAKWIITYTVTADGVTNDTTSTKLTFVFSASPTGLTAAQITITDGSGAATKGALSGSGTTRTLAITDVSEGGITVKINNDNIDDISTPVTVYKGIADYSVVQVGGALDTTDSTGLKFTFTEPVIGLTPGQVTITPDTGDADVGLTFTPNGNNTEWTLAIEVNTQGNIDVKITKSDVKSDVKTGVAVYKRIKLSEGTGDNPEYLIISNVTRSGNTTTITLGGNVDSELSPEQELVFGDPTTIFNSANAAMGYSYVTLEGLYDPSLVSTIEPITIKQENQSLNLYNSVDSTIFNHGLNTVYKLKDYDSVDPEYVILLWAGAATKTATITVTYTGESPMIYVINWMGVTFN